MAGNLAKAASLYRPSESISQGGMEGKVHPSKHLRKAASKKVGTCEDSPFTAMLRDS